MSSLSFIPSVAAGGTREEYCAINQDLWACPDCYLPQRNLRDCGCLGLHRHDAFDVEALHVLSRIEERIGWDKPLPGRTLNFELRQAHRVSRLLEAEQLIFGRGRFVWCVHFCLLSAGDAPAWTKIAGCGPTAHHTGRYMDHKSRFCGLLGLQGHDLTHSLDRQVIG